MLDISTSGMVAQRTRLEVISANVANSHSIYDAKGNFAPYRRRVAVLAAGDGRRGSEGVHVAQIQLDQSPFRKVYDPQHPHADPATGMVDMPNINPAIEQINAMEAQRAYEANLVMAETTKSMIQSSLRILA